MLLEGSLIDAVMKRTRADLTVTVLQAKSRVRLEEPCSLTNRVPQTAHRLLSRQSLCSTPMASCAIMLSVKFAFPPGDMSVCCTS